MSANLYIGLMSGTSLDGIDAVLVSFENNQPALIESIFHAYDDDFRYLVHSLVNKGNNEIERLVDLDIRLARLSAQVVNALLDKANVKANEVSAIGSHGQTIRHFPHQENPTTLQVGDPNTIAELTGITTVADFRRRDMAAGGQGAPLVPAFHQHVFHSNDNNRVIVNIGGIGNITILPANRSEPVSGFDTGPGNCLLDYWIQRQENRPYDKGGIWARDGEINQAFLDYCLKEPYFSQQPPKSTGTEYFNPDWLSHRLSSFPFLNSESVQASLTALTAQSIANAIKTHATNTGEIIICGGGVHNDFLLELLSQQLQGINIQSSAEHGLDPDYVEATAFAWLAKQTLEKQAGNLPSVTGATKPVILGGVYFS